MKIFRRKKQGAPAVPTAPPMIRTDPGVQYRPVRRAFGLDISDGSLKAMECTPRRGGYVIQAHGQLPLAADVVQRGEIQKPEDLQSAITTLLQSTTPRPITTRHVLVSFGGTNAYLHPFEFPRTLTETQVRRAVPYEAEGELPITLRETYTDIQFHRSRAQAHHVLFAAAPRKLVDAYVDVLVRAGLLPVVFEIESLALARALVRPQDEPVFLLDVGGWSSTITTVERGMAHGAVSIPVGGFLLTTTLAAALGVSAEDAEQTKRTDGLEGAPPEARAALEVALLPLVEEVKKAAMYHETHTGRPVQQLILSGGTALLKGIVPFFTQHLSTGQPSVAPTGEALPSKGAGFAERTALAVTLGDPLILHPLTFSARYPENARQAFTAESIVYANSIGLAIRGAAPGILTTGLNLLPPAVKQRYLRWWEHAIIAALSVLFSLTLLAAVVGLGLWDLTLALERMRLAHQVNLLAESVTGKRFQQVLVEAAETNAEITVLTQFDRRRVDVSRLLRALRQEIPEGVVLTSVKLESPAEVGKPLTVAFKGVALRRENFLEFEKRLRARSDVTSVDSPIANLNRAVDAPFLLTLTVIPRVPAASPTPLP